MHKMCLRKKLIRTEKHAKEMKKFFAPILSTIIFVGCGGPPSAPNQNPQTASETQTETEVHITAPTIKVYVENSGSMYGYVKGPTDFENAVYNSVNGTVRKVYKKVFFAARMHKNG